MAQTDNSQRISQFVVLIAFIVAIGVLYFARNIFIPFSLAILFAFFLTPVVRVFDKLHVPRMLSCLLVVTICVALLGWLTWTLAEQMADVAGELPQYRSNVIKKIDAIRAPGNHDVGKAAAALREIEKDLVNSKATADNKAGGAASSGHGGGDGTMNSKAPIPVQVVPPDGGPFESLDAIAGPIGMFGIVAVFTLFMLMRREDLRNRFIRLIGHQHLHAVTRAIDDATSRVSTYFRAQFVVNASYGLIVGISLHFIGVPHALLWGVLAALMRFLPYVGFLIASVLPVLLSIAIFDGWARPILTFMVYALLEVIVANLVEPLLYGAQTGISSLAILVAAVFWTVLWGPIGLILSTPLTVCVGVLGRFVPQLRGLNILLGDEAVLPPESQYYQRLLDSDRHEARSVLEKYISQNSLHQLYDAVLMPALALAERDRHANNLDENTERFITITTKAFIEDLYDRQREDSTDAEEGVSHGSESQAGIAEEAARAAQPLSVACMPARDDADEIVSIMLSQLIELAGHASQSVPLQSPSAIASAVAGQRPDVVFISALPPLAVAHAKDMYHRLLRQSRNWRIVIGLWNFSGDAEKVKQRIGMRDGDKIVLNLEQAIAELEIAPAPAQETLSHAIAAESVSGK
jgi:predicted PurR-regulated permease PerM